MNAKLFGVILNALMSSASLDELAKMLGVDSPDSKAVLSPDFILSFMLSCDNTDLLLAMCKNVDSHTGITTVEFVNEVILPHCTPELRKMFDKTCIMPKQTEENKQETAKPGDNLTIPDLSDERDDIINPLLWQLSNRLFGQRFGLCIAECSVPESRAELRNRSILIYPEVIGLPHLAKLSGGRFLLYFTK